jgi:hypothetical protein
LVGPSAKDSVDRYDAAVRRGCRLLSALTPAVLVVLVAVSPALPRYDATLPVAVDNTTVRDLESAPASVSVGVAERVPVPIVWPMQSPSVDGVPGLAALSWIVFVLAVLFALGSLGLARRDRAPPRLALVHA